MALMNFPLVTKVGENKPIRLNKSKIRKINKILQSSPLGFTINQSRNSDVENRRWRQLNSAIIPNVPTSRADC